MSDGAAVDPAVANAFFSLYQQALPEVYGYLVRRCGDQTVAEDLTAPPVVGDGLPVPEVAGVLGRTLHATEALLVRARIAFRNAYEEGGINA